MVFSVQGKKKCRRMACGIGKSGFTKKRLWIPGNRREKINSIRNEATDDNEKQGNTTISVYHNEEIISQENILCPNRTLSDRIQPAHLDGSK
jgi:hypothetical protein